MVSAMNPWTLLGLNDDADERTVKRQYAKLLKVTRPDEDPEAFQRLREALRASARFGHEIVPTKTMSSTRLR